MNNNEPMYMNDNTNEYLYSPLTEEETIDLVNGINELFDIE